MTSNPKITVIIPVYNVEQYLRQCLDSAVNQTMPEIQIICVNDGSPDGSRAILQEYADRDSRIEIIDKPNGGLSSARNTAYPLIKGKYTLFVDSDDWIDLALCEKTYQKAEETGAQMTVFSYHAEGGRRLPTLFRTTSSDNTTTVEDKMFLLSRVSASACIKLWQTDFLLSNQLYFPEGLCYEDTLVHWQAVTRADRISAVPERFYHYRDRPDSITRTDGKHTIDIITVFGKIREYLLESGYYTTYGETFMQVKLWIFLWQCQELSATSKQRFVEMVRESLSTEDREFIRTAPKKLVPLHVKYFYEMIDGHPEPMASAKYYVALAIFAVTKRSPGQIFHWVVRRIKDRMKDSGMKNK
jgi:glycosyltransferase involved in cell wall biosynthesis